MNTQRELEIKAIQNIYVKLYKNAYPSTNYQELVDNAIIKNGKKLINSKAHSISKDKFNKIIENELSIGHFSNLSKLIIKQTIIEGCCPKITETCK